jgi:ADP-ribose pyrophosphatase YjhB (NUDIX family)
MNGKFMIRVYALFIHSDFILVCDENYNGVCMTKFPGGGVQYGEGIRDALIREIQEEMQAEITDLSHFYTTDFFQASAFHPDTQLISVYYRAAMKDVEKFPAHVSLIPTYPDNKFTRHFRWIPLKELTADALTFPIDKYVAKLLNRKL